MNPTTFVYVIWAQGTSKIKMGISADPEKRLRHLQTASAEKLMILGKWPGSRHMERALHRELSQYRQNGEWFTVPPFIGVKIIRAIENHKTAELKPVRSVRRAVKRAHPMVQRSSKLKSLRRIPNRPPTIKGYKLEPQYTGYAYYRMILTPTENRDAKGRIMYQRKRTLICKISYSEWEGLRQQDAASVLREIQRRLN